MTIAIRNAKTGLEKTFADKQQVADFLHGRKDKKDWEGHERLGKLPDASDDTKRAAEDDKPAETTPVKVATDDGAQADESAGRHLVEKVEDKSPGHKEAKAEVAAAKGENGDQADKGKKAAK